MQFIDLNRQYLQYKKQIDKAISQSLNSSSFILGKEVSRLEGRLAEYVGSKYCLSVANGTDALHIAEMALGIDSNCNVILPSYTWVSTAETIEMLGAEIRFADIDEDTFNICPNHVSNLIDSKTKLIIGVSLFGQTCDLHELQDLANHAGIKFLEDGAQSFGAMTSGVKSCSYADVSTTSFFPSKPLGCYGDGGAIFTNDEDIFKHCKLLARHGQDENKVFQIAGFNSRLDEIQAAILNIKLDNFDKEIQLRQDVAEMYRDSFSMHTSEIKTPFIKSDMVSAYAQYTIQFAKSSPKSIQDQLKEDGIPSVRYYTPPVHIHPAYEHHASKLEVTEMISRKTLSLPFHPYMTHEEIKLISESVIRAL
ncbi:MAG TPA: aminotransferase DegT [Methylophilaceae bacterium]|nr:aminotransferase DegT [Methylophilaceae bacterium]